MAYFFKKAKGIKGVGIVGLAIRIFDQRILVLIFKNSNPQFCGNVHKKHFILRCQNHAQN